MQPTHKYLSNLTPLRGIAALWVVVFHFQEVFIKFVSPDRTKLVAKGYITVDLFFIMSGFIISHVYQQSFQPGLSAVNFRRFAVARFARIYPLHFFTLLVLVILVPLTGGWNMIDSVASIPTNLFLIHSFGIHKVFTWNVPSWSISAEWWAYMAFPFLIIFLYRQKKLAIGLLSLFIVLTYVAIMFWLPRKNPFDPTAVVPHDINTTFDYGYLRGLAGFVTGMLLYKIYDAKLFWKIFRQDITAIIVILGTILCLHIGMNDGVYIILFIGVVFSFALNNGKLHALCNNGIAQYIGKISYSIYLIQLFPSFLIMFKLPGVTYSGYSGSASFARGGLYCFIYLLLVIGFASLTYFTIEKPCRKFINAKWGKEQMPVYA
jgi:peptidoglycan/LPS O-acetylase OafA/YrhL